VTIDEDLFSREERRRKGEFPDVYRYDSLPHALRVQVIHILKDCFGPYTVTGVHQQLLAKVHASLCREYGVFWLKEGTYQASADAVEFFLTTTDINRALDFVQLTGRNIEKSGLTAAIAEINARFREHGVGYQYESGRIVLLESAFLHAEVVRPALSVLRSDHLRGAEQEFLAAHEHYRHGRNKEAMNECLKAFESTLKGICVKRSWSYPANATASALIEVIFNNDLIPAYLKSHFSGLRSCLESGVPTVRNKASAHGQGSDVTTVPASLVSYVLNATAAAIKFLDDADREKT
jgi:AbiJ N-terminal domain 4